MSNYSYIQSPFKENHRLLNILAVIILIGLIAGLLYWWTTSSGSESTKSTNNQAYQSVSAQVASILRDSSKTVTAQEIKNVSSQLSSLKTNVTATQKQTVANILQTK